jgi:hypothetical protein
MYSGRMIDEMIEQTFKIAESSGATVTEAYKVLRPAEPEPDEIEDEV